MSTEGAEPRSYTLKFDLGVYPLVAIQKAAYNFGDRFFHDIQKLDDQTVEIVLTPRRNQSDMQHALGEFRTEVLDQHLRQVVLQETSGIRDLLIAQAFSRTNLVMPELDSTREANASATSKSD